MSAEERRGRVMTKYLQLFAVRFAKRLILEGVTTKDAVKQAQVAFGLTSEEAKRLEKSLENY